MVEDSLGGSRIGTPVTNGNREIVCSGHVRSEKRATQIDRPKLLSLILFAAFRKSTLAPAEILSLDMSTIEPLV